MRSSGSFPLFRYSVGFDRLDDLFETAFRERQEHVSYPPYNIVKTGQDTYRITLAVAGFGERDLDIIAQENLLTVQGPDQPRPRRTSTTCIGALRGARFEHRFQLADHVKVTGAKLRQRPARHRAGARGARGDEAAEDRDRRRQPSRA